MLVSHDSPISGASPPSTSCVSLIQCTSEEAFVGQAETIPPTGVPSEYRGLQDPPEGPYVVGVVQPVPLPAGIWLIGSGCLLLAGLRRRA
jgi:hypothetical protein